MKYESQKWNKRGRDAKRKKFSLWVDEGGRLKKSESQDGFLFWRHPWIFPFGLATISLRDNFLAANLDDLKLLRLRSQKLDPKKRLIAEKDSQIVHIFSEKDFRLMNKINTKGVFFRQILNNFSKKHFY